MLWIYIVRARVGENDARDILRSVSREVNFSEWPGILVAYYLGNVKQTELLKAANDSDPKRRREKQCEANFYIGQQLLIEGKKAEATKMFKAAMTTNVTKFVEYEGSRIELQRLASAK
jgi:lipoprotein NlpI